MATARRFGHAEVFASIFALSFLVARFVPVLAVPWVCPVRALWGIPCATCGMTRAFVALAHGDAGAAFAASPLGTLVAAGAWVFAAAALARAALGTSWPRMPDRVVRAAVAAGVLALLANWAFLLAREVAS
ncbi:MAG TPA: DUF2752 domain-containing protein [Anaeromyxobacteraceae bacterium]|nr:DUF2752 domain-containing protein [Anaeromyxobacteraceae bacterium]